MYQLAAVFSPGFEKVIPIVLNDVIPDASKIIVSSGFVRFCVDKKPFRAKNADFFNNSFLVLKEWNARKSPNRTGSSGSGNRVSPAGGQSGRVPTFEQMANKIKIPENILPEILKQNYKSFRLRFSKENVFTSVNKQVMANVEKQISMQTEMKPNRLGGDTEFWFLTRSDGYACFALRMTKKQSTEKYLEKGELRPEFVTLLAAFAGVTKQSLNGGMELPVSTGSLGGIKTNERSLINILDPFAGHGGIVKQLYEIVPNAKIIASEIDNDLVKKLQHTLSDMTRNVTPNKSNTPQSKSNRLETSFSIHCADATHLDFIADKSIDIIITDPPWGFYVPAPKQNAKNEKQSPDLRDDKKLRELYDGMLKEFYRIIKPNGTICILTGAKEIFESAFDSSEFAKNSTNEKLANSDNAKIITENRITKSSEIRNDVLVNGKKAAVYVWKVGE